MRLLAASAIISVALIAIVARLPGLAVKIAARDEAERTGLHFLDGMAESWTDVPHVAWVNTVGTTIPLELINRLHCIPKKVFGRGSLRLTNLRSSDPDDELLLPFAESAVLRLSLLGECSGSMSWSASPLPFAHPLHYVESGLRSQTPPAPPGGFPRFTNAVRRERGSRKASLRLFCLFETA